MTDIMDARVWDPFLNALLQFFDGRQDLVKAERVIGGDIQK